MPVLLGMARPSLSVTEELLPVGRVRILGDLSPVQSLAVGCRISSNLHKSSMISTYTVISFCLCFLKIVFIFNFYV